MANPLPTGFLMNIEEILKNPFSFTQRKVFTPCETRPIWKCSLVILIIGLTGRNKRCSQIKIHTANWLTKSPEHYDELREWSRAETMFPPHIRFDPTIDRAIDLIVGNKYAYKIDGKIALTDLGEALYLQIIANDIMMHERNVLTAAKKLLSEAAIKRIFKAS